MKHIVVGLGNPGEEYENTRHNVGRMVVMRVAEQIDSSDWRIDKKLHALRSQGVTEHGDTVELVLPDNYMNRSGGSVAPLVKNAKQAERLVVVHDDIDLPLGSIRVVFNRGAGGHNGVLSIERALKTRAYVRVRVGVIPTTPSGKLRKPAAGQKIHDFILKQLSKKDREAVDTMVGRTATAVLKIIHEGRAAAMQEFN
jgi:PTH1 family peptidyl-tRNA hydrolase